MNDILNIYKRLVDTLIRYYHKDNEPINPLKANRAKSIAKATIVVVLFTKKWQPQLHTATECAQWLKGRLAERCALAEWLLALDDTESRIVNSVEIVEMEDLCLGNIYEMLLSVDTNGFDTTYGKRYRNQLGSYYTPEKLVDYLTKSVIDNYTNANGVENVGWAKIVDFSCGGGIFLVSAIRYIARILSESKENVLQSSMLAIINNVYACDVDCIALEVAKFSILELTCDLDCYATLCKHFVFGNFLLHNDEQAAEERREKLYLEGYIYHPELAIGTDFLTEYDIILGNPPWDKIRFEEKKFYSQYTFSLNSTYFRNNTRERIASQEEKNESLANYAYSFKSNMERSKEIIKSDPYFANSATGELNTCTLFADACYSQVSVRGVIGIIIKSSTVTSSVNRKFFNRIFNGLYAIYDFINREKFFDIDSRERFSLLIVGGTQDMSGKHTFNIGMNLRNIEDIEKTSIKIGKKELVTLNPDTHMLPNIMNTGSMCILLDLYGRFHTIGQAYKELQFGRLVHYTNHADYIGKSSEETNLPVYEGKFFQSFDGRYSGYNNVPYADRYKSKAQTKRLSDEERNTGVMPLSRFYINKDKWEALSRSYRADYMLAWHSLTSATNGKACVSTILPFLPASQSVQFLITDDTELLVYLACLFNSVVFDFIVKNKLNGIDLTQTIIKQMPIPTMCLAKEKLANNESIFSQLVSLCHGFLSDDCRMDKLWHMLPAFAECSITDRQELQARLDALVARLYGLSFPTLRQIISVYPSLYNSDTIERIEKCFHHFK